MTTRNPVVSVVIPAYNRAASVGEAIQSVLRQTYSDFELLVVDDCSTDGTRDEVRKISDRRVTLLESPRRLGPAGARNQGIAHARGAWIAFQDSDDEWLPRKLEMQMKRLTAPDTNYVGSYCGLLALDEPEEAPGSRLTPHYVPEPWLRPLEGDILPTLLRGNVISTQTLVIRRQVMARQDYFDPDTTPVEDWDLALSLAQLGPISFIDEPLVLKRLSPDSISLDSCRSLSARKRVLEKHMDVFQRYPGALALQYFILAGGYRRKGDFAQARQYLASARETAPWSPKFWVQSLRIAALDTLSSLGVYPSPGVRPDKRPSK